MSKIRVLTFVLALIVAFSTMSCDNLGKTIKDLKGALDWVKTWGGANNDLALDIFVDTNFNVYVIGTFRGYIDFNPSHGIDKRASTGLTHDCFLVKFNSVGDYGWTKTWNGKTINDVKVDSNFNIYVTGEFEGTVDMNPSPLDDDIHTSNGLDDCYLIKFDRFGNYQWAKTWGGSNIDFAQGIAIDSSNYVYVVGSFQETVNFNTDGGVDNRASNGFTDCFLTKFNSNGTWLWAHNWGGTGIDFATCAAADSNDNVYVAGVFFGTVNFDPGAGIRNRTSNGDWDCFLSKFNAVGGFIYANTWGGTGEDGISDIAIDSNDNVFVSGVFSETVNFDPGAGVRNRTSNGGKDCFLSKFTPAGNFEFVNTFGGSSNDFATGVTVDTNNNVYLCGAFKDTVEFNPGGASNNYTSAGGLDCFVISYDNSGNFKDVAVWGGTEDDVVMGIGVSLNQEVFVSGYFSGKCDFDTTDTTEFAESNGGSDCFLAKFK